MNNQMQPYSQIHSWWAIVDVLRSCGRTHEAQSLVWYIKAMSDGNAFLDLNKRINELNLEVI